MVFSISFHYFLFEVYFVRCYVYGWWGIRAYDYKCPWRLQYPEGGVIDYVSPKEDHGNQAEILQKTSKSLYLLTHVSSFKDCYISIKLVVHILKSTIPQMWNPQINSLLKYPTIRWVSCGWYIFTLMH